MGKIEKAVEELNAFLDTVYTDIDGWLELADIHSSCYQCAPNSSAKSSKLMSFCRYTHALEALSHALLLAPQNPFTFLQFAETAYTAGDIPLALKNFLIVIDMNEEEDADSIPQGIFVRAWWGVKLVSSRYSRLLLRSFLLFQCTRTLVSSTNITSASGTPVSKNIKLIDELATERVLTAYSGEHGVQARSFVSSWMSER